MYVYKKYNKYLKSESFIKLLFRDIYKIGLTDYEILRNSYGKILSNVEGYYYRSYEIYCNNILAICTKGNVEEIEIKEVDISNEGVCYF